MFLLQFSLIYLTLCKPLYLINTGSACVILRTHSTSGPTEIRWAVQR